ncbi:MAG: hypothetical protein GXP49_10625 [Deltaproteobacteria bacterium]|nr:hypothetical protein [Deltaproteobacteria bacterium]
MNNYNLLSRKDAGANESGNKKKYGLPDWLGKTILSIVAILFLRGNGCGHDLIQNPDFDLWCGDSLCSWDVEGKIERVPTWHEKDYGVALVGNDVKLSQLANLDDTLGLPKCFEFDLLVKKDDQAELFLEMDFQDDGTLEYSHPIPSGDWTPVDYKIKAPTWYSSVRFIVRKTGPGKAVLARIRVQDGMDCMGTPLDLDNRPDGTPCEKNSQCSNGFCTNLDSESDSYLKYGARCTPCKDSNDCGQGQACSFVYENQHETTRCDLSSQKAMGERCVTSEECSTGICCKGTCSSCCSDQDCPLGQACTKRSLAGMDDAYAFIDPPFQCAPGLGAGKTGDPCLFNDDCISNECLAEQGLTLCAFIGQRCSASSDCPKVCLGPDACGDPACLDLGKRNGVCK